MKTLTTLSVLTFTLLAQGSHHQKNPQEMQDTQEIKRLHLSCKKSGKSSANCHKDMMKACNASREKCLKKLERMNMDDVIRD